MTSDLPDDPYHALGLTKDADSAAIKSAYRKLVLKHHPDKVQDESQKQTAADLFHKVQAAWETIGDEDKRARYDAQCKLAALRKEVGADRGGQRMSDPLRTDLRSQAYRSPDLRSYAPPQRSASYRTEEIRPSEADYFDKPRSRDYENVQHFDRPRRTPPKEDRRTRVSRQDSKESERARRNEKVRQSTKATARDRDRKYAQAEVESDSESDYYAESRRRSPRQADEERRERERYMDQLRRQQEEAASSRYYDERTQQKFADAQEHMQRSGAARRQYSDPPRRPSPPRTSSRDYQDVVLKDGRPYAVRRGSGKPRPSSARDDDLDAQPRRRGLFNRSSSDFDEQPKRPASLSQAKSAPNDIRNMAYDKPRASSLQHTREELADFVPTPVKRADSMPQQPSRSKPTRSSTLQQMQNVDDDYGSPRRHASSNRSRKEYADDNEYATPDGYIIENREPSRRNRSPEPSREKTRSSSTRFPVQPAPVIPPPLNTRTTSYTISPTGKADVLPSRPKPSRENSGRRGSSSLLYREVPSSREFEPFMSQSSGFADVREIRPDTFRMQSGYSTTRRSSEARSPGTRRGDSFNATAAA